MKQPSKCHPERLEMFSSKVCHRWERGLCPACHAKASRTRVAIRDKINRRLENSPRLVKGEIRGPRTAPRFVTSQGVGLAEWFSLVQTVGAACIYCRRPSRNLSINYLVPLERGGRDIADNALPTCPRCIHRKGQRLITEWPDARDLLSPVVFGLLEKRTRATLQKLNLTQELNSATLGVDGTGNEKDQRETGAASGAR